MYQQPGTKFIPKGGQQQPKRKGKPHGLKYRKDNHNYMHAARARSSHIEQFATAAAAAYTSLEA